jgi:hypothetical protein
LTTPLRPVDQAATLRRLVAHRADLLTRHVDHPVAAADSVSDSASVAATACLPLVLAVYSGSPQSGATTACVMLEAALRRRGDDVLLMSAESCWEAADTPLDAGSTVRPWMIADTSAGNLAWGMRLWSRADERLVVTTPARESVLDSYTLLKQLSGGSLYTTGIVVNGASCAAEAEDVAGRIDFACRRFLHHPAPLRGWLPRLETPPWQATHLDDFATDMAAHARISASVVSASAREVF